MFSVAARVFNAGLLLVTHVALARLLGAAEFGVFSLATTWVLALLGLATMGLTMTPQRFMPEYAAHGGAALIAGLHRFSHVAPLAAGFVIALGGAALLQFFMPHVPAETRLVIALALFALPALAVIDVVEGFALAHDWNDLAYGVTFIVRPLLLPALLAAAWLGGSPATASSAIAAFVASAWMAALCLAWLIRARMAARYSLAPRRHEPRRWFALALPAMLADGAFLTMAYADVLLLSAFASPAEVGVYVAATKIVGAVAFVQFGLSYAAAHHFSRLHALGEHDALLGFALKAARWTFWPSLAAAGLIAIAAPALMNLFGDGFGGGALIAAILLAALVGRAFIGPSDQLLMMTDRQGAVTAIYGVAAVLNVALVLLLAPGFGAPGVALGAGLASLAATLATAFAARRAFGCFIHAGSVPARSRKGDA